MPAGMIYVRGRFVDQRLDDFAAAVQLALALDHFHERESGNYAEGYYFAGGLRDSRVTMFYLDTEGLEQYLFGVHIDPSSDELTATVARSIAATGLSCFVPLGPWHLLSWDGRGTPYEP
jgi:hypothetical protein